MLPRSAASVAVGAASKMQSQTINILSSRRGEFMSTSSMKDMRRIFAEWPVSIPKAGLVVTTFGESIPFCSFMLSGDLLLLERKTPDAQGTRRILMCFDAIYAIKILDAIEMARFTAMGFQGVA